MKQHAPWQVKRMPVVVQFMLLYMLIALIVLVAMIPLYNTSLNLLRERSVAEAEQTLDRSVQYLQSETEELYMLPLKMNRYEDYTLIKLSGGDALPSAYYEWLNKCEKLFTTLIHNIHSADEVFMLLTNNQVLFSSKLVFTHRQDYFSRFMIYQDFDMAAHILEASGPRGIRSSLPSMAAWLHPAHGHRNTPTERYLTFLFQREYDSAVVGAVFSEAMLLSLFNYDNLPPGSVFQMTDSQGTVLLERGTENPGEGYSVLQNWLSLPAIFIRIAIPDSHFAKLLTPVYTVIRQCVLASAALAFLFGALFAVINYLPVRRLMRLSSANTRSSFRNEYRYLHHSMEMTNEQISSLKQQVADIGSKLRETLLVRLLYGVVTTEQELALGGDIPPVFSPPMRVAVVRSFFDEEAPNSGYLSCYAYEQLRARLPSSFLPVQLDCRHTGVLLPESQDALAQLCTCVEAINAATSLRGVSVICGVSQPVYEMESIHGAFQRTKALIAFVPMEEAFHVDKEQCPDSGAAPITFLTLKKLYDLLMAGNSGATRQFFAELSGQLAQQHALPQSVFAVYSAIHLLITSVAGELHIEITHVPLISEEEVMPASDKLLAYALELIEAIASKNAVPNRTLAQEIVRYIHEHFDQPTLYAQSISEHFGVSRRTVFGAVKAQTGKTIGAYVEALRMDKALQLITGSALSMTEISERCGYHSANSFYKAFKKRYGDAPSAFRSS